MKILLIRLFVLGIRVLYLPMKWRKTKNKILYVSRQSNTPSADMLALKREIEKRAPQTDQVFRLKLLKDEKGLSLSYLFWILGDMWEMATAKVVVADTYSIPLSCLCHKKGQSRVQIWHALAAIKQFGLQSAGKAHGRSAHVAKVLCMHQNYTHVVAPSKATGEFYQKAFGCKQEVLHIASLPRVDEIQKGDNRREEFLKENPRFSGKKLALYLPTFREGDGEYCKALETAFEKAGDWGLIVAPHPLSDGAKNPRYQINGTYSTYDLMKLAEEIITDYSACGVEGALLRKPLRFYLPDYDSYKTGQGLNVDPFGWFPRDSFVNADDLVRRMVEEPYSLEQVEIFAGHFVEHQGTNNAKQMAEWICSLL